VPVNNNYRLPPPPPPPSNMPTLPAFMSKLSLHTGITLLVMSLILMIPSCIGVEEYNTRPVPVVDGTVDKAAYTKLKHYRNTQIVFVTLACVGIVAAIAIIIKSESMKYNPYMMALRSVGAAGSGPPSAGGAPTVELGGVRRSMVY
jgi:hypothetical protein